MSDTYRTEELTDMQEDIIEEYAREPGITPRTVCNRAGVNPAYASHILQNKFDIIQSRSKELGHDVTHADFGLPYKQR